jgi:hypothetical protein
MYTFDYARFGRMCREHRAERPLRDASLELGLSSATLLRIERGELFDLEAMLRICSWMDEPPGRFIEGPGQGLHGAPGLTSRAMLLTLLDQDEGLPEGLREAFGTLLRDTFKQYPTP